MDIKHCVVLCTCPNEESGQDIATTIIEEKLAACTNIVPKVQSLFFWEQQIESANEVLLIIKTLTTTFPKLEAKIASIHPYDCPEIIALPVIQGHADYLNWMEDAVSEN